MIELKAQLTEKSIASIVKTIMFKLCKVNKPIKFVEAVLIFLNQKKLLILLDQTQTLVLNPMLF